MTPFPWAAKSCGCCPCAAGSLVVVLLAVLFGLVIATLQRIDRHAARTHTAGKQIAQNTVGLWALDQMNRDLVAIRGAARGAEHARTSNAVIDPLRRCPESRRLAGRFRARRQQELLAC